MGDGSQSRVIDFALCGQALLVTGGGVTSWGGEMNLDFMTQQLKSPLSQKDPDF